MSTSTKSRSDSKPTGEPVGEAAFLAQQSADATAAIQRTISAIGKDMGTGVNVAGWTRQYPWLSLGASTLAAFVATSAVVPSREQQALRKLARIERALHPDPPPSNGNGATPDKNGHAKPHSLSRLIVGELIKIVQPVILGLISSRMGPVAEQSATAPQTGSQPQNPGQDVPSDQ